MKIGKYKHNSNEKYHFGPRVFAIDLEIFEEKFFGKSHQLAFDRFINNAIEWATAKYKNSNLKPVDSTAVDE